MMRKKLSLIMAAALLCLMPGGAVLADESADAIIADVAEENAAGIAEEDESNAVETTGTDDEEDFITSVEEVSDPTLTVADEDDEEDEDEDEDDIASGTLGDNLTWVLDCENTLTISGVGAIEYTPGEGYPWDEYQEFIDYVIVKYGVTSIGDYAFDSCHSLKRISLPDSLEYIGMEAFSDCIALTEIAIPGGVSTIGSLTFMNCQSLSNVVLKSGVTSIGAEAFGGCRSLTKITIPSTVTAIDETAFEGCSAITDVYFDGTEEQWETINIKALEESSYDGEVYLGGATVHYGVYDLASSLTSVRLSNNYYYYDGEEKKPTVTVMYDSNTLTEDEDYTVSYSNNIEADDNGNSAVVTIIGINKYEGTVTKTFSIWPPLDLEEYAKENFLNITLSEETYAYDGIEKKPEVTVTMYTMAFGWTTLTENVAYSVSYSDNTEIGTATVTITGIAPTYTGSVKATFEIVAENAGYEGTCGDDLFWILSASGELTISGSGAMYDYETDEKGVSSAPWFACDRAITSVVIQDGATSIGAYAFCNAKDMASITIPDSVTVIGERAFVNCVALTNVIIPDAVSVIAEYTFFGCTNLQTVQLPDSVTIIGAYAFQWCSNLAAIDIPPEITFIGESAFESCTSLTSVVIPGTLKTIQKSVFFYCTGLTNVTISEGVENISDAAFSQCTNLKSVVIPVSVSEIGAVIFSGCNSLETIVFMGNAPSFNDAAFYGLTSTVYYPASDASWVAVVGNDYEGTIKWIAYGGTSSEDTGESSPSYDVTVVKDGLTLDDDKVFRFYQNGTFANAYSGVVAYEDGLFFIKNGLIDTSANELCLYEDVWYYVSLGQVQTQYTGLAMHDGAWFYITDGILDTSKNGLVEYDGELFLVASGKFLLDYNGLWLNSSIIGGDNQWYFIGAGMVQYVSQVVMYDGAWFVVENGVLDSDYNGTIIYDGVEFQVVNGQLYS